MCNTGKCEYERNVVGFEGGCTKPKEEMCPCAFEGPDECYFCPVKTGWKPIALQNEPDECDICPISGEDCGSCLVGIKKLREWRENLSNTDEIEEDDLNIPF